MTAPTWQADTEIECLRAQLAASEAEIQKWVNKASLHNEAATQLAAALETSEASEDALRWSLLIALAERDDALWEIERINGRTQLSVSSNYYKAWQEVNDALRDIRAICARALAGSKRIKEDE